MIYRVYTVVNGADTCRDPDDLHFTELGATPNLEAALAAAMSHIKNHFFHKDTELIECNDGIWRATDFCSYGATLIIEPMKEIS